MDISSLKDVDPKSQEYIDILANQLKRARAEKRKEENKLKA